MPCDTIAVLSTSTVEFWSFQCERFWSARQLRRAWKLVLNYSTCDRKFWVHELNKINAESTCTACRVNQRFPTFNQRDTNVFDWTFCDPPKKIHNRKHEFSLSPSNRYMCTLVRLGWNTFEKYLWINTRIFKKYSVPNV